MSVLWGLSSHDPGTHHVGYSENIFSTAIRMNEARAGGREDGSRGRLLLVLLLRSWENDGKRGIRLIMGVLAPSTCKPPKRKP